MLKMKVGNNKEDLFHPKLLFKYVRIEFGLTN